MRIKILKVRQNTILTAIATLSVICTMILSFQNIVGWHAHENVLGYSIERIATTQIPTTINATLNKAIQVKLEKIRHDLNYSQPRQQMIYPARGIGKYVMLDPFLCTRGEVEHIDVIIIVHTAPANLHRRQRIRETFASETLFLPFHVRVAFLLGKTENRTLERVLWFEHASYNDTVMGDFVDSYHNLSLKGVMGYRWVSQYCPNSKYVLKIDDDVMVNTFKLLYSFFNHMSGKRKSIFCNLWHKDTMPILREGKWKVESNVFAEFRTFPFDYCSGFVVIMTTDLLGPLFRAAMKTPFFWIDDVYLFGMLPHVVGGVTYYNYALDQNVTLNDQVAINCTKTHGPRCGMVASITTDAHFWDFWNLIKGIYAYDNSWKVENKVVF